MPRVHIIVHRTGEFTNQGKAIAVANANWDGEWTKRYFPNAKPSLVQAFRIDGSAQYGPNDTDAFFFNEELVSSQGVGIMLFIEPGATDEQIERAKSKLRGQRDVVRFYVFRITEWIEPDSR